MGGGTEAFPELGGHCQLFDCHQLDFLPFTCDGCHKEFCLEHRSYKSHECPKSDVKSRKILVCEICSSSIETTGKFGEDEKEILERHSKSKDCNPSMKKKPLCPVKRCKENLTFSNTAICKTCNVKICLRHRFPADHACQGGKAYVGGSASGTGGFGHKFLVALGARNGQDCAKNGRGKVSPTSNSPRSIKAC